VANELMDVLYWVLNMCSDLEINIPEAFERKMKKNEAKYPINKAKGKKEKYTKL
jgi:NTP pyrophosphatase (non-canonical NTP hydrolase)